jgi:hypothetical protein
MTKEKWNGLKPEFKPGGAKRQEILDKAVSYIADTTIGATQQKRHEFCIKYLEMSETEYLEALNKATNGGLVAEALWT